MKMGPGMKRTVKISLITAGAAFALGLVLFLTGLFMGGHYDARDRAENAVWGWLDRVNGFDYGSVHIGDGRIDIGGHNGIHIGDSANDIGDSNGTGNTSWVGGETEAFQSVNVDLDLGDVKLVEGDGYRVDLDYDGTGPLYYSVQNGQLSVWSEDSARYHYGVHNSSALATITVPTGTALTDMTVDTDMGNVTVDAAVTANSMDLSTDMGNVTCKRAAAKYLTADSDMGNVKIEFPVGDGVDYDLSCDMGEVRLNGVKQGSHAASILSGKYQIEAESSMGDVTLNLG